MIQQVSHRPIKCQSHKEVRRSTGHIMVTTRYSDQEGSKSRQRVMRLYKQRHRPILKRFINPPYSILLLLLLSLSFLTFSVLVANPKKLLYTVANPARGLLNREKRTKAKVWQHTPPPTPHTARSEKINKITRRIYRRYAGLGRSRVRTRIPSARRLGLWVRGFAKILHSRLR